MYASIEIIRNQDADPGELERENPTRRVDREDAAKFSRRKEAYSYTNRDKKKRSRKEGKLEDKGEKLGTRAIENDERDDPAPNHLRTIQNYIHIYTSSFT